MAADAFADSGLQSDTVIWVRAVAGNGAESVPENELELSLKEKESSYLH